MLDRLAKAEIYFLLVEFRDPIFQPRLTGECRATSTSITNGRQHFRSTCDMLSFFPLGTCYEE